jgi:hypothetical protein
MKRNYKFKAISIFYENGAMSPVTAMRQFPYITGMVSISADAAASKPIAILKTLEYLGDFSDLESRCVFATSMYKWITNELWTYSALVVLV